MHSSVIGNLRAHYNSDVSGEVYLMDTRSDAQNNREGIRIEVDFQDLENMVDYLRMEREAILAEQRIPGVPEKLPECNMRPLGTPRKVEVGDIILCGREYQFVLEMQHFDPFMHQGSGLPQTTRGVRLICEFGSKWISFAEYEAEEVTIYRNTPVVQDVQTSGDIL